MFEKQSKAFGEVIGLLKILMMDILTSDEVEYYIIGVISPKLLL